MKFGSLTLFEKFSAHLSIFSRKFYIYLSSIVCLVNKDVCSYVDISLSWMKRFLHSVWKLLLCFSAFLLSASWLLIASNEWQISNHNKLWCQSYRKKKYSTSKIDVIFMFSMLQIMITILQVDRIISYHMFRVVSTNLQCLIIYISA